MAKKTESIAKVGETGLSAFFGTPMDDAALAQRPDFIAEGDKTGTEGITSEDIRLPRVGIAQGLSPQMTPGDSQYIEDLKMFQMYNDSSQEIYGMGPIYFIAVKREKRCIEFRPRSEGGGIVDMDVPWNDDRATKWRKSTVAGEADAPPPAVRFNEFVILILKSDGTPEPCILSIKNTNKYNRRAASDLNGFIKAHASQGAKSVPIYGVIYSLESRAEKNDNGTFGVPKIGQVGFIPPNAQGQALYERAREYAASLEGKQINIDRTADDEPVDGEVVNQ